MLETQLWIPRLVMAVGMAALSLAVVRTILLHIRRLRDAESP